MQTLKTILYATDFSDLAANAFYAAFALDVRFVSPSPVRRSRIRKNSGFGGRQDPNSCESGYVELAADLRNAYRYLARDHGARLILLYVKQPQEVAQGEFGMTPPEPELADAEIREKLNALIPTGAPVPMERLMAHGVPAETIVQVARENHCDLLVLGTHGRRGLARFFHGNLADSRAGNAPSPAAS